MGLTNKSNLKSQADLIRYEDSEGQNTAERVGKMLVDIIEATDSALTTEAQQRESKDNALQTTLNSTTIHSGKFMQNMFIGISANVNIAKTLITNRLTILIILRLFSNQVFISIIIAPFVFINYSTNSTVFQVMRRRY